MVEPRQDEILDDNDLRQLLESLEDFILTRHRVVFGFRGGSLFDAFGDRNGAKVQGASDDGRLLSDVGFREGTSGREESCRGLLFCEHRIGGGECNRLHGNARGDVLHCTALGSVHVSQGQEGAWRRRRSEARSRARLRR